jgi:hypothetical protein
LAGAWPAVALAGTGFVAALAGTGFRAGTLAAGFGAAARTGFFTAALAGGRFFAVAFTDRTFFEDAPRFAATDLDFTIFFDFAFVLAAFLTAGFALERALGAAAAFALGRAFALAAALVRAFRGAGLRPDLPARAQTRVFDTDLVLRFVLVAISGPCILTGTRSTLIHRNGMDKPASRACFMGTRAFASAANEPRYAGSTAFPLCGSIP